MDPSVMGKKKGTKAIISKKLAEALTKWASFYGNSLG